MKNQINTLLKTIGLKADEIKLAEAKLKDGETTINAEPDFESGAAVMVITEDGQEIPVPVSGEGEAYELEDGRTFTVVEEGVIGEVMEAGAAEEEEVEEEEVAASGNETETPLPKAVIESIVKETKFSKEEMDAKDAEITELKAKIEELEKVEEETEEITLKAVDNPEEKATRKYEKRVPNRAISTDKLVMSKLSRILNK